MPSPVSGSRASLHIVPLRDTGKENGNYYIILGLYRDNGKENGNYYIIIGYTLGVIVPLNRWGSDDKTPKVIFYLLQEVYTLRSMS